MFTWARICIVRPGKALMVGGLVTACSGPQSALDPAGPSAAMAAWLWWLMFAMFTLVFFLVVGLWLYALWRKSEAVDEAQARRVSNRWIIGGGILLPSVSILIILSVGLPAGYRMLPLPQDDTLTIHVIGHQWWWEVHYPDAGVTTANELFLPVRRTVDLHLSSADVIHSFWLPRLAGKLDVLPGRTNVLRLEADEVGSFRAQCAEFCGWGHAHMTLPVQAQSQQDFDKWLQQRREVPSMDSEDENAVTQFQQACGDCHRVNGVSDGVGGPDLSSVAARPMLGGVPKRESNPVAHWLRNHKVPEHETNKEDEPIPDHRQVAPEHHEDIASWLETLVNE